MTYFTKEIVDANGITKKQFYKSLWCEDFTTGEIVQTRVFVWEHTKEELLTIRESVIAKGIPTEEELLARKKQSDIIVEEIDSKLAEFA